MRFTEKRPYTLAKLGSKINTQSAFNDWFGKREESKTGGPVVKRALGKFGKGKALLS